MNYHKLYCWVRDQIKIKKLKKETESMSHLVILYRGGCESLSRNTTLHRETTFLSSESAARTSPDFEPPNCQTFGGEIRKCQNWKVSELESVRIHFLPFLSKIEKC